MTIKHKRLCKRLTIFEGPDCSGKTTAAKQYAAITGARYVHFANLPRVDKNLARMYVEAMLPALLGYEDVVFDRCWLSEVPYGTAFRDGVYRLSLASERMLERLSLRCGGVVVHCRPPWVDVESRFIERQNIEYLQNAGQLKTVYDMYGKHRTGLPEFMYDYTQESKLKCMLIETIRTPRHPVDLLSAGNWDADIILVGERFAHQKDCDSFYQWPFASFSSQGCCQWLTDQLELNEIGEKDLFWVNADQDLTALLGGIDQSTRVVALGDFAAARLNELGVKFTKAPHPQYHKRFSSDKPYSLFDIL